MRDQLLGRETTYFRVVRLTALMLAAAIYTLPHMSPVMAAEREKNDTEKAKESIEAMTGIGWGIGIATNFDVGGRRVGTAAVDGNNIVRVEDSSTNASVSFVLEAHYFLQSWNRGFNRRSGACPKDTDDWINCTTFAHGPFVAIEMGGGNSATNSGPISGYALGWMLGMRHPYAPATVKGSWNIGVGLRVTPNAKVLGDGITANQPLPAGDTLRYKTEPRYGVMLMSTFSF
jgi:hypothetical protein